MLVSEKYPKDGSEVRIQSTSKGDQRKWFYENEWLKGNKFGYEGLSEWVVYELLKRSNLDPNLLVPYYLCNIHTDNGQILEGCYSRNFLNEGEELVTLQRILNSYGMDLEDVYQGYSIGARVGSVVRFLSNELDLRGLDVYFQHMLALDAIVLNEDRHTNNIAFIRDIVTGNYRLCPLFDHGLSLLSDTTQYNDRYGLTMNMDSVKAKPFNEDFIQQYRALKVDNPLVFNREAVVSFLGENKDILGRIYDILKVQMERYSPAFV